VVTAKVGLFGGTFDPIHNGHLRMAERVLDAFGLDRIWFIPARIPPHKEAAGVSDPWHRYAMVALATADNSQLVPSALELRSEKTSYTIHTINRVRERLGRNIGLYFLMGTDSWREIETWKDHRELLARCSVVLLPRHGSEELDGAGVPVIEVRDRAPASVPSGDPSVYILRTGEVTVSSTSVRERASRGESLAGLVPDGVERYLRKQGLYEGVGAGL
jgi:nicotinate-nucleotide adenylyltransferase